MNWIPVERGAPTEALYLVCGRNDADARAVDFGFWFDGGWWAESCTFTPQFYAVIEWPPELDEEGSEP